MQLIISLQNLSNPIFTFFLTIFDFFGQTSFFVLLFSILFLFVNKELAYKFFISYQIGFVVGSLVLKNIVKRLRPYDQNQSLFSTRSSYGFSLPNEKSVLSTTSVTAIYKSARFNKQIKTKTIFWTKFILIICCIFVCVSQLYFAEGYLLDVLLGAVLGLLITILITKTPKITSKFINIFTPAVLIFLLFVFAFVAKDSFTNNFANSAIFEFVGISFSLTIGYYLENKFINYKPKNNLIFTSFKLCITLIVLICYYYLCKLLPGLVIFSLAKYFVAGFIVTILLPVIFKSLEKYFYIFAPNISKDNVVNSYVSISEKHTKKIANKILKNIKMGDCVLLKGDLGAGKSVLVRQILQQSGVVKPVTSPTFTLVNEYKSVNGHFYHFDMYRLMDEEDVYNIGFEEIIDNPNCIKFIEWPQKVENYLPKNYKQITIVKLSKKARNIVLEDFTKD